MDKYSDYQSSAAFNGFDEPPKRRGEAFFRVIVIILLILLIALVMLLLREKSVQQVVESATPAPAEATLPPAAGSMETPRPTATPVVDASRPLPSMDGVAPSLAFDSENPIPDIFEAVSPSVVGILNYVELPIGDTRMLTLYGSGTGFVISSEGYVLTNAHVIENAVVVTVKLSDGREIDAEIIGRDLETDVAVLRIDATGIKPLACGNSDDLRVGEYVLAIGNPLDSDRLANTLTFGILSAKSREITIDSYTNEYLQTDAAINYGNSGGPLLNMKGEVIGVNSAKSMTAGYDSYGNRVSAEGIGFALPINRVLTIMDQLVKNGTIVRPGIGITVTTVTEVISKNENIPVGAYVEGVVKDGPADKGGLKAGDVIVEANGEKIVEQSELIAIVGKCAIGDELKLNVCREGKYLDVAIVIANKSEMNFNNNAE